jgi:hypothetical protein
MTFTVVGLLVTQIRAMDSVKAHICKLQDERMRNKEYDGKYY